MLYVLLGSLAVLLIISFYLFNFDYFSPCVIVNLMFFISTAACIINSRYWKTSLSLSTYFVIIGGNIIFTIVGYSVEKFVKRVEGGGRGRAQELRRIEIGNFRTLFVALLGVLLVWQQYKFVNSIVSLSKSSLVSWGLKMEYYRNVYSYDSSNLHISAPALLSALNKICMMTAYYYVYILINNIIVDRKEHKKFKIDVLGFLPIILYIFYQFLNASRSSMLLLFIAALVIYNILYHRMYGWRKKYSLKSIAKVVLLVFILMAVFVGLRSVVGRRISETAKDPLYYVCTYAGGPIHLLNDFIANPPQKSNIWGSETFYSLIRFVGTHFNVDNYLYTSHLEFRYSNGYNVGNIYTAYRKYIYDFGYIGLVLCTSLVSIIDNSIYAYIKYRKSHRTVDIWVIIFGYLSYGYFYMSIQEQTLSALLNFTTLLFPVLYYFIDYGLRRVTFRLRDGKMIIRGGRTV